MRIRTWCVAMALLSPSMPAMAQTVVTEADALARLSPDSPRVRAIRAPVDVARADVLAVRRWPNPRATFNRESVAGVTENMVTVAQPLPITGRRGLDVSAASALVEATAHRADDQVRLARAELRSAYADLVSAQVRETELAQARDRLRELVEVLGRRESAGESAGYDRLRAEREVIDVETELASARAERVRAQAALGSFFAEGTAPATLIAAVPPAPTRAPLPALEALVQRANAQRGELMALGQEAESARFAARAAARRSIPEPEVVAGTKSSSLAGSDIGTVFSIHATVPLFDRGSPERAMAQARLTHAESRAAAFRIALASEIAGLRAAIVERREAAERYRATSLTAATQLERIAQVSYEAGERGILELLDAYRGGATARTRQAVLDAEVRQAEIELEFVSGWELQ